MTDKNLSERIASILYESDYMLSAPGIRGVGLEELTSIVDFIRKTNTKKIDLLYENIKYFYQNHQSTIQTDKTWQRYNCPGYEDSFCDCFLPNVSSEDCYCNKKRLEYLRNTDYRNTPEYREWRISVFERDKYTCQYCYQKGGELNAHHIKEFKKYPKLRYKKDNGTTLCVSCHRKEHSNG